MSDDLHSLIRQVRQRLESLVRAGLGGLAVPPFRSAVEAPATGETPAPAETRAPAEPSSIAPEALAPEPPPPAAPRRAAPAWAPLSQPGSSGSGSLFAATEGFETPPVDPTERPGLLAALAAEVACCVRCPALVANRTQTVFGEGSPHARLMFIGEAPGADEDRLGRPFVGRAGQLLNDMITKGMGLTREEVYIANILKSRPPENREPMPDEAAHCLPYLERQIEIIRPEFLCLLGRVAVVHLLDPALSIGRARKRWHSYRGIPTIATYHPAYLLRNPPAKKDAWEDLQILMKAMGIEPPAR